MSDDIKTRLKDASEECQKCYGAWSGNDKDDKARQELQDAIHELRKVASRLEIELAISERDQLKQRPLPIPPHRDAKSRSRHVENEPNEGERQPKRSLGGSGSSSSPPPAGVNVERKPQRRPRPLKGGDEGGDDNDNVGNAG